MWLGPCSSGGPCPRSECWSTARGRRTSAPPPGCPARSSWPGPGGGPRHLPPPGSALHPVHSERGEEEVQEEGERERDREHKGKKRESHV